MRKSVAAIFFGLFAISMMAVVMHLFPVGDPRLPAYAGFISSDVPSREIPRAGQSVALYYNRYSGQDMDAASVVCGIILDYRGYDTLYETTVLFTAVVAVLSVIGVSHDPEDDKHV